MSTEINDVFSGLESLVRFDPTVSVRFLAEEIRRYGIKTNSTNDKGKTLFFQSAHIIMTYNTEPKEDGVIYPSYGLVSFKDLFKLIGKNDNGVDDQDIVRTWYIADKLEKRRILTITGTAKEELGQEDSAALPDVYANLHHIYRNDAEKDNYVFKSKFATNKMYTMVDGSKLICVADYFLVV